MLVVLVFLRSEPILSDCVGAYDFKLAQAPRRTRLQSAEVLPMPHDEMHSSIPIALFCLVLSSSVTAAQHRYSKAVQKACAKDYKQHCGQYGVETEALRLCMDRAGRRLSKRCVDALVAAGEVSKQEVERRKRTGR
jgi:hypothetical protein